MPIFFSWPFFYGFMLNSFWASSFLGDYVVAIECCSRLFYSIRQSPINESDKRHSKHSRAKKFSVTTEKCHFSSFIACYLMTQFQYSVICDRCAAVCWMQIGITLKRLNSPTHIYLKNKKKFRRSSKWFTFDCNEKTRKFCLTWTSFIDRHFEWVAKNVKSK